MWSFLQFIVLLSICVAGLYYWMRHTSTAGARIQILRKDGFDLCTLERQKDVVSTDCSVLTFQVVNKYGNVVPLKSSEIQVSTGFSNQTNLTITRADDSGQRAYGKLGSAYSGVVTYRIEVSKYPVEYPILAHYICRVNVNGQELREAVTITYKDINVGHTVRVE